MCKRGKGSGREGEGQVLRTVRTRDICDILCVFIVTSVPKLRSILKIYGSFLLMSH